MQIVPIAFRCEGEKRLDKTNGGGYLKPQFSFRGG